MNDRQYRVVEAGESGVRFVGGLKEPPLRLTEAADRLHVAVSSVHEASQEQIAAKNARAPAGASIQRAKTVLLRKHLHPIAADGLQLFAGLPGIEDALRVPRSKDTPAALLKAAERVRRVAVEHEQEFITQRKYDEDFLEQFDESVQALDLAVRLDKAAARARYTLTTREVKECIGNVRRALDVLDTTMRAVYLDDKKTLALWRHAIRVPARRGRPKKRKTGSRRARTPKFKGSTPPASV
jgi:hypothetical protein